MTRHSQCCGNAACWVVKARLWGCWGSGHLWLCLIKHFVNRTFSHLAVLAASVAQLVQLRGLEAVPQARVAGLCQLLHGERKYCNALSQLWTRQLASSTRSEGLIRSTFRLLVCTRHSCSGLHMGNEVRLTLAPLSCTCHLQLLDVIAPESLYCGRHLSRWHVQLAQDGRRQLHVITAAAVSKFETGKHVAKQHGWMAALPGHVAPAQPQWAVQ